MTEFVYYCMTCGLFTIDPMHVQCAHVLSMVLVRVMHARRAFNL